METEASKRALFRGRLLGQTITRAFRGTAGYKELYGAEPTVEGVEDLASLPVTTKDLFMARGVQKFRQAGDAVLVQHTGGTTRNTLLLHRGAEELDFCKSFFSELYRENAADSPPICLSLLGRFHGQPLKLPHPGKHLDIDLADRYWNDQELYAEPWKVIGCDARPAILVGLESQLRILTCRLVESDFDFRRSAVQRIVSTGDLITRRLRSWYQSTWGVPLIDRYSISEVIGGAEACELCKW